LSRCLAFRYTVITAFDFEAVVGDIRIRRESRQLPATPLNRWRPFDA